MYIRTLAEYIWLPIHAELDWAGLLGCPLSYCGYWAVLGGRYLFKCISSITRLAPYMHIIPTMVQTLDHPGKYVNKLVEEEENYCWCQLVCEKGGRVLRLVVPTYCTWYISQEMYAQFILVLVCKLYVDCST